MPDARARLIRHRFGKILTNPNRIRTYQNIPDLRIEPNPNRRFGRFLLSTSFTLRAILATLNETVDEYNEYVVLNSPGVVITLKSVDSALSNSEGAGYPVEFINTLDPGCLPPHKLNIKTGVPLMLIRTINPPPPILTNETRCVVIQVHGNHLIEAEITTEGPYLGQRVFIPRIPLTNSDGRGVPLPLQKSTISRKGGIRNHDKQKPRSDV